MLLKDDRSSFYFEHDDEDKLPKVKQTFTIISSANDYMDALVDALNGSTGCLQKGAIVYYAGDKSTFYAQGLFELTYNPETMVYYFKSFGGLGNKKLEEVTKTVDGEQKTITQFMLSSISGQSLSVDSISKFVNIRYIGSDTTDYYSGTGGSEQVEIVARIVDGDTVYERYFLVTVSA